MMKVNIHNTFLGIDGKLKIDFFFLFFYLDHPYEKKSHFAMHILNKKKVCRYLFFKRLL